MKSTKEQLHNRGYIEDLDIIAYENLDKVQLLKLLESDMPTDRTFAARLLRNNQDDVILEKLVECLLKEKMLYSKIELSESIGAYGEKASVRLVKYLGKVGNNQHHQLPTKPFMKKNYPLPRDIIARTLCKIGVEALPELNRILTDGSYDQKLEAIDAIGFISFYSKDKSQLDDLIRTLNQYKEEYLLVWKILRAMQSFDEERVRVILRHYMKSEIEQHRWEAKRGLEQLDRMKKMMKVYKKLIFT